MTQAEPELGVLVAQAQSGDQASLAGIFERMHDRVFRFFAFRTARTEEAEDLTQTVFLEMIQALPRYKVQSDAKFTTWLFQIARFRLIDHYRKLGRTVPLEEAVEPADRTLEASDPAETQAVEVALRTLPEKYQTVLHLRYREDLDTKDIAASMNLSVLNVRVLQHRALKALRAAVNQRHP